MKRIVYTNAYGTVSVVIPAPSSGLTLDDVIAKDVPAGMDCRVINTTELPTDRIFRAAWELLDTGLSENLVKSKLVAHDMRRQRRDDEMKPLDVLATVPQYAVKAEKDRQAVRDKYAVMQVVIDGCMTVLELRAVL